MDTRLRIFLISIPDVFLIVSTQWKHYANGLLKFLEHIMKSLTLVDSTKVPETCRITPVRKEYQGGGLALASAQLEEDFCGGVELIQVEPFVGGMGLLDGPWTEDDGWQASG